uniref:Secreted protein n=1 Tax=Oryza glaberrima TaxID=4538 RepID=I1P389_ORYGL
TFHRFGQHRRHSLFLFAVAFFHSPPVLASILANFGGIQAQIVTTGDCLCRCVDSESLVLGGMDPWPWLSALVRRRLAVKNVSNPLRTEDTPLQHAPGLSLSWSRGSC